MKLVVARQLALAGGAVRSKKARFRFGVGSTRAVGASLGCWASFFSASPDVTVNSAHGCRQNMAAPPLHADARTAVGIVRKAYKAGARVTW